ncbi:MAG: signal transduction protein [Herbinix sp.]|jgi:response regulator RpfG family c-di-GMP phosphodiesterase|nr:signal transduction protein [Herbinix sp.]
MKKILIVDDEIQILNALSRMFIDTDYEIFSAENGMDALKLIETTEIDMVISDMRMPILDGFKLLSIVKEKYPKIIRIILSAYAEEKPMFRALLHNVAKLYVFKPWNNNELLQSINKLFEDDIVINSSDLLDKINEIGCATAMSENCEKMLSLIEDENMDALITEIEQDPEISALLLQVAKSAVYGVMPNTIKQAAIYIGLHNLKCFLHWACAINPTNQTSDVNGEPELLLKHAYYTNRIFLFLYEAFLHKQPPESTMFAGLMHNIGLILLSKGLQKNGSLKIPDLTSDDYIKLEMSDYKVHHQEVGAHFLDLWDIPFPMYEVALFHHRPLDSTIVFHELVSCVHIAQHYAWKALNGKEQEPVSAEVFESIGVLAEDFEKRLARYLK